MLYLRLREYDQTTQRFISRDNQAGWNRYGFADAEPLGRIDPFGNSAWQQAGLFFSNMVIMGGSIYGWYHHVSAGILTRMTYLLGMTLAGSNMLGQVATAANNEYLQRIFLNISAASVGAMTVVNAANVVGMIGQSCLACCCRLPRGRQVDDFTVTGLLGRGNQRDVFSAIRNRQHYALKIIREANAENLADLQAEAGLWNQLYTEADRPAYASAEAFMAEQVDINLSDHAGEAISYHGSMPVLKMPEISGMPLDQTLAALLHAEEGNLAAMYDMDYKAFIAQYGNLLPQNYGRNKMMVTPDGAVLPIL